MNKVLEGGIMAERDNNKQIKQAIEIIKYGAEFYHIKEKLIHKPEKRWQHEIRDHVIYVIYLLLKTPGKFAMNDMKQLFNLRGHGGISIAKNKLEFKVNNFKQEKLNHRMFLDFLKRRMPELFISEENLEKFRENEKRQKIRHAEIILTYKDSNTKAIMIKNKRDYDILFRMLKRNKIDY